jgi:hypothetical protein
MRSNEGCWACDGRGAAAAAASPSPSATAQRIGAGGLLLVLLRELPAAAQSPGAQKKCGRSIRPSPSPRLDLLILLRM